VKKLQARAEAIIASNSKAALNQIHELMAKHGLTTADIDAHIGSGKNGKKRSVGKAAVAGTKIVSQTKGKLPAKYLNPRPVKRGVAVPVRHCGSRTSRTVPSS
jgi:hypothetical protein